MLDLANSMALSSPAQSSSVQFSSVADLYHKFRSGSRSLSLVALVILLPWPCWCLSAVLFVFQLF